MSGSRSRWPVARHALVAALFAGAGVLGGCSAGSTVADHLPNALGGLPEGTCKVIAAQAGFKSAATTVTVKNGATMSVKLALAVAPVDKKQNEVTKVEAKERPKADNKPAEKTESRHMPGPPPPPMTVAPSPSSPVAGGGTTNCGTAGAG